MDLLSNYICSLKNACKTNNEIVEIQASKLLLAVSNVLKAEGLVENFRVVKKANNKMRLQVKPSFKKFDYPVTRDIKRVSKPGMRVYWSVVELKKKKLLSGGNYIISTPKGVVSDLEAIKNGLGGEVLCKYVKQ